MRHLENRSNRCVARGYSLRHVLTVLVVGLVVLAQVGHTQASPPGRYTLELPSRVITPMPGVDPALEALSDDDQESLAGRHVYIQLERNPDLAGRARLAEEGIELLSYLGAYTWHAVLTSPSVLDGMAMRPADRATTLSGVRWVGAIEPRDRIAPRLLDQGADDHARGDEGWLSLVVSIHPDVPLDLARQHLEAAGARISGTIDAIHALQVEAPDTALEGLMHLDAVRFIDQAPAAGEDDNDELRAAIGSDAVNIAPYDLDGSGVTVGQWETGHADTTHDDFGGRVTVGDLPASTSSHATHVCGTILGDGTESAGEGGDPEQWRGVAPNTSLVTFRRNTLGGVLDIATMQAEYTTALDTFDIALSNNSWGTGHYHQGATYDAGTQLYDQVVRGSLGRPIAIVGSAGNQGPRKSGTLWGTVRIPNSAKNTIEVGNIFSDRDEISWSSSTGPTEDGRLKPDVVAPGDQADDSPMNPWGTGDKIRSTVPTDTYGEKSGTSMSTPAVSGVLALMLQQYRQTFYGDETVIEAPLPSTYKAILCHTATDLVDDPKYHAGIDFVGPDYIYGYGRVDAQAAVDVVRDQRFVEGAILSEGDEDTYTFEVEAGEPDLVVTLAWDDVAANPGDALANILKNDLDLLLVDPSGTTFHTPWELDPDNPETPAARNTFASQTLAVAGRDTVNVVEQAFVDAPAEGTWTVRVLGTELPFPHQRYSIVAGRATDDRLVGQVDIVQVLDRSGSMGGLAASGDPENKITILRSAAHHFIDMMRPGLGNQLGLVQFNQDVVPFPAMFDTGLQPFTVARATELGDAVDTIVHGGATSIGDGLAEAHAQLTTSGTPGSDRVVLLVTDGKENSAQMIADVEADLIADEVTVYPLGLGFGSGIDEEALSALAEATGGSLRVTSDDLIFRKFFIEVLAAAVDWMVIVDPIGKLAAGETAVIPVDIAADETGATFTTYWSEYDDALELELLTPGGAVIDASTPGPGIRHVAADRHAFYQVDFPLVGTLAGDGVGRWEMQVKGASTLPTGAKARYSASAFAEGGTELEASFDRLSTFTGEEVALRARLSRGGHPLTGARVEATCDVPTIGAGNVLRARLPGPTGEIYGGVGALVDAEASGVTISDPVSAVDLKLARLERLAGRPLLTRDTVRLDLFDRGQTGDGAADDGLYANALEATQVPGTYTCRFVASGIPAVGGGTTTREWSQSFHNRVAVDPASSTLDLRWLRVSDDRRIYRLTVTPRDRFGNYLGPGRSVRAVVMQGESARPVVLDDDLDGTYSTELTLSGPAGGTGQRVAIEIEGRPFTQLEPPAESRWSLSLHTGVTEPGSELSPFFDAGRSLTLDLTARLTPRWSLVGLLGRLDLTSSSPGGVDDSWTHVSIALRHRLGSGTVYPWARVGLGYYSAERGAGGAGAHLGLGVAYQATPRTTFELGTDFHTLFGEEVEIFDVHSGVSFRF